MAAKSAPRLQTNDKQAIGDIATLVGHTMLLDPNDIAESPNVRAREIGEDEANEIRLSLKRGQIQNVTVKPNVNAKPGEPRFIIVDGRRRLAGAKLEVNGSAKGSQLNVKANPAFRLRVFVMPVAEGKGSANSLDTFALAFKANDESEPMTPLDKAHVYHTLRTEYKLDDSEARKRMGGISAGWSNVFTKLMKLPAKVREALEAGDIDTNTAADCYGLDDEAVDRVLEAMTRASAARKKVLENAKADPSIAEKERAEKERKLAAKKAAREAAQEERRKANAKKKEAGQKLRGNANKKAPLRASGEVRAAFANLIGNSNVPKNIQAVASAMFDYLSQKAQFLKVEGALIALGGYKPGEISLAPPTAKPAAKEPAEVKA